MRRRRGDVAARHAEIDLLAAYGLNRKQIALLTGMKPWAVWYHQTDECGCGLPYGAKATRLRLKEAK